MQVVVRSIQFSDHLCPTITNMLLKITVTRVLFSTPTIRSDRQVRVGYCVASKDTMNT